MIGRARADKKGENKMRVSILFFHESVWESHNSFVEA